MNHTQNTERRLVIIGDSNWDIYADGNNALWAIAKPNSGAKDSYFGDIHHIKRLMNNEHFCVDANQFTETGLALFEGLFTRFMKDSRGKSWTMLSFAT